MAEISPVGFDATVRHATYLERLKAGQVKALTPFLREMDAYLRARLSLGELTDYSRARLEKMLAAIDRNLAEILQRYQVEFRKELRELAKVEARFEARSLTASVDRPRFEAAVPAPAKVVAVAFAQPLSVRGIFGGQLLPAFLKGWNAKQREILVGRIRRGVFEGEPNAAIARAIRGNPNLGFADGTLAQIRNQSAAMVRTSTSHISHAARLATFEANSRVVKRYRWLSTLDDKTSEICQGLSGEVFEVGQGPVPPAHPNCRSTIVAVLEGDFAAELRKGRQQASKFGPVDADQDYFQWMKQQPKAFQEKALGPVKAKLLRDGGLSGREFRLLTRNDSFRPLTLREMQRLEPTVFEKAGIRITDAGVPVIEGA